MDASELLEIAGSAPTIVRRLANGLTVVVREQRASPVVALVTHVTAGYLDEDDDAVGIAHVLEHMYFKGTQRRGPGEMARETRAAGGYLNASTSYDHTRYYTVLPAASLEQGMVLQADALGDSIVDADELGRELRVIIEEAKRKRDSPTALARETMYATLFDTHRMRRWRIGTEAQLERYGRDDVVAFYRARYVPDRIVVAVVGDVAAERALELVEREYGALPARTAPGLNGPKEPARAEFRYRSLRGDVSRAYVEWGWRGAAVTEEDTPALELLAQVLGHGRASRLYREVREPGHVLSIGAGHFSTRDIGVFEVTAETRADRVDDALRATADAFRRVLDAGIAEEEVDRARRLLVSRVLRRIETVEGQANLLADWQARGDWRLALDHLRASFAADAPSLTALARARLDPRHATVLVYTPEDGDGREAEAVARTLFDDAVPEGPAPPAAVPIVGAPGSARFERAEDGVRFYRADAGRIAVQPKGGSGLVTLVVAVPGGAIDEARDRAGITTLAMRVSTRGTSRLDADAVALASEVMGTTIQTAAGTDHFAWRMTVPAADAATAARLLCDVAFDPVFPDAAVERERQNLMADVAKVRDDMVAYPQTLMYAAAWAGHPYGFPLEALEAALPANDRARLLAWHRARIAGATPWFIVAGDVDADTIAAVLAGAAPASSWHEREPVRTPAWPPKRFEARAVLARAQTALAIGMPGPDRNHEDRYALSLAGSAVSGLGGRAFEELRSRRALAYTVSLRPHARRAAGMFAGYIATSPDREDEAREALIHEMQRLAEVGVEADELERARRSTLGARDIRRQTTAARAAELADALVEGRGLAEIREFEARVLAVDTAEVRRAARRWLDPARAVLGVVVGRRP